MRPWRQFMALSCACFALICILNVSLASSTSYANIDHRTHSSSSLASLFSFRGPTSFFPPNAIISLTHENSTTFLARPAAFGPTLPTKGLSGQLWVGSGFGDDIFNPRGIAAGSEGEMGCSDIQSLSAGQHLPLAITGHEHVVKYQLEASEDRSVNSVSQSTKGKQTRKMPTKAVHHDNLQNVRNDENDETDDYLHKPMSNAVGSDFDYIGQERGKLSEHADIQSLQESAEIAGKVVLLSRGGCGFAEKVKWAQRRGAIAVIIGDNIRGGPLVHMKADGDSWNITIPSLFTSHTTAHLLSSLMPVGLVRNGRPATRIPLKDSEEHDPPKQMDAAKAVDQRTFTQVTTPLHSPTSPPVLHPLSQNNHQVISASKALSSEPSWLAGVFWSVVTLGFRKSKPADGPTDSRRPPSSGNIDWFMVEDWDLDEPKIPPHSLAEHPTEAASDSFVIGIQDWRDPDVIFSSPESEQSLSDHKITTGILNGQETGSITPGSGEYSSLAVGSSDTSSVLRGHHDSSQYPHFKMPADERSTWLQSLKWTSSEADSGKVSGGIPGGSKTATKSTSETSDDTEPDVPDDYEGLWVTLTPSSISTSPFFDTLIILVVSPLVTLTIVYTMLLLRSRIRRRRWRAPKSVVDQLPVRTYQKQSTRASSPSAEIPSPNPCTSTTPLLLGIRSVDARPRPRSRTISGTPDGSASSSYGSVHSAALAEQEKQDAGLAEWRRRYGGKQVECVVCLEEYIDGVSKVMSLPCGHEFHVDCITPWLTTRRRTCPICKGDVVRSLAKHSQVVIALEPGSEDPDEILQAQSAESTNSSPSTALPITSTLHRIRDLESGEEHGRASQSLPSLRVPRNLRTGLLNLANGRSTRSQATQPLSSQGRNR